MNADRPASPARRRAMGVAMCGAWTVMTIHGSAGAAVFAAQGGATSPPAEVREALPLASLRGQGRFRYFGLTVYDAQLWAEPAFDPQRYDASPLALSLRYARRLEGQAIAARSLSEMARQGPLDEAQSQVWLKTLQAVLPDVAPGDRLTGVLQPGVGAQFYCNGRPSGPMVLDLGFASRFFGIWLSPQTSAPDLRAALLGHAPAGQGAAAS